MITHSLIRIAKPAINVIHPRMEKITRTEDICKQIIYFTLKYCYYNYIKVYKALLVVTVYFSCSAFTDHFDSS